MLEKPEPACFVIADISGYTSFLSGVELDHAQDIIADLMDTVVKGLRPPFRLAKFEGDAAFVYAVAEKVDGTLIQDAIEGAYFAFRRRLRSIKQSTTCECNACRSMHTLDFKFVSHFGEFVKQKMGGRTELAGKDVILIHRLLKNGVSERLGGHAYALYSQACIAVMGIDPAEQGLIEHHEQIDIIGDVTCWVRDLEESWKAENERKRVEVTRDGAGLLIEIDIAAPRPMVWEYFSIPEHRPKWHRTEGVTEFTASGRRGVGTRNHCMHGKAILIEDVVDWRPFDYVTMDSLVPIPDAPRAMVTYAFAEKPDGGTHVEIRLGKPKAKDRAFFEKYGPGFVSDFEEDFGNLKAMMEGMVAAAPAVVDEPPLPGSSDRFLTEPVHAH